jgi:uncharacterized membrane protein
MRWRWNDQEVEQVMGNLLRAGVMLAAAVVLIGGVMYLARDGHATADYRVFRGEPSDLRTVPGIVRSAATRNPRGIIQLGLLLLVATPLARVAFSIVAFALERDYTYVVATLIVLAVLLYSLAGGHL